LKKAGYSPKSHCRNGEAVLEVKTNLESDLEIGWGKKKLGEKEKVPSVLEKKGGGEAQAGVTNPVRLLGGHRGEKPSEKSENQRRGKSNARRCEHPCAYKPLKTKKKMKERGRHRHYKVGVTNKTHKTRLGQKSEVGRDVEPAQEPYQRLGGVTFWVVVRCKRGGGAGGGRGLSAVVGGEVFGGGKPGGKPFGKTKRNDTTTGLSDHEKERIEKKIFQAKG